MFRLLTLFAAASAKINDCAVGKSVFSMKAVTLLPADPVPGENVTLHLEYVVPAGVTITDGTAQYDVSYNFIPFSPTIESLCYDVPCPLGPGLYMNDTISQWPTGLSGTLVTKITWFDLLKNVLLCISIQAKF
jgi:hypothetical protein